MSKELKLSQVNMATTTLARHNTWPMYGLCYKAGLLHYILTYLNSLRQVKLSLFRICLDN